MASATSGWIPTDPDQTIRVRLSFDWDTDAIEAALKAQGAIDILEPAWIRRRVIDAATRILTTYREGSTDVLPELSRRPDAVSERSAFVARGDLGRLRVERAALDEILLAGRPGCHVRDRP